MLSYLLQTLMHASNHDEAMHEQLPTHKLLLPPMIIMHPHWRTKLIRSGNIIHHQNSPPFNFAICNERIRNILSTFIPCQSNLGTSFFLTKLTLRANTPVSKPVPMAAQPCQLDYSHVPYISSVLEELAQQHQPAS